MSLDGKSGNCELPDYPVRRNHPAALTYVAQHDVVAACGGRYLTDTDRCWIFDGSSWSPLPNSKQRHCWQDSPNLAVEQGWWITGPRQINEKYQCTNEWTSEIFNGKEWIPGPPHPTGQYSHHGCAVNLNTTHSMFIGGDPTVRRSWIYNWISGTWTETGMLNTGRHGHGCVNLGEQGILAVGKRGGATDSVELYNPVSGTWSQQADPDVYIHSTWGPILLGHDGRVIAMFRENKPHVYELSKDRKWSVLQGVQLPKPFSNYIHDKAVLVPSDFAKSCM